MVFTFIMPLYCVYLLKDLVVNNDLKFQNDFSVPLKDVPILVASTHYPDRDPHLKDNWRGRPRQDISNITDKIIKVSIK